MAGTVGPVGKRVVDLRDMLMAVSVVSNLRYDPKLYPRVVEVILQE